MLYPDVAHGTTHTNTPQHTYTHTQHHQNMGGGPQPVWALGLSCETPVAPPDRAAGTRTRQPENSKRAHTTAPTLQTPPKFHEKTRHPERHRKSEMVAGQGRKRAKIWAVRRRGVQWRGEGGPAEGGSGKSKPATHHNTRQHWGGPGGGPHDWPNSWPDWSWPKSGKSFAKPKSNWPDSNWLSWAEPKSNKHRLA